MDLSEIRYVKSGESHIAYQIVGTGPRDLLVVPGIFTHLEAQWYAVSPASITSPTPATPMQSSMRSRSSSPGVRRRPEPDRVLATILFTDIVGSTERAAELGDRRWRALLSEYYAVVLRCALRITEAVERHGLTVRSGVHTGEVETAGGSLSGIAVHIGARIMAMAGAGEVLVSSTVKELSAGSGIDLEDRGIHVLKGVPGGWQLFAAAD